MREDVFSREYPFNVIAEEEGGYTIVFPDLPGCMTQVETLGEVGNAAEEIKFLWLESVLEQGLPIPNPTYPQDYSGRLVLRLPRSLHRDLAHQAEHEGVSLNQYLVSVLAEQKGIREVAGQLDRIEKSLQVHNPDSEAAYALPSNLTTLSSSRRPQRISRAV